MVLVRHGVGPTRGQQQQSKLPDFRTRSPNDARQPGADVSQVAPVPAETSASDAPACAPIEEAGQGPARWL